MPFTICMEMDLNINIEEYKIERNQPSELKYFTTLQEVIDNNKHLTEDELNELLLSIFKLITKDD